jgi:hypothetical protein
VGVEGAYPPPPSRRVIEVAKGLKGTSYVRKRNRTPKLW